jgi:hypothetical protein
MEPKGSLPCSQEPAHVLVGSLATTAGGWIYGQWEDSYECIE